MYIFFEETMKENDDIAADVVEQKCNNNKYYTLTFRYYIDLFSH